MSSRQPIHTVYGGAHLFRKDVCGKLGAIAERAMTEYAPDAATMARVMGFSEALAETVYSRVMEKLRREPVENFHIDFEDGFGVRPDAEEDAAAVAAAGQVAVGLAAGSLPAFLGIRVKPFNAEWKGRALRTLRIFLDALLSGTGCRARSLWWCCRRLRWSSRSARWRRLWRIFLASEWS